MQITTQEVENTKGMFSVSNMRISNNKLE